VLGQARTAALAGDAAHAVDLIGQAQKDYQPVHDGWRNALARAVDDLHRRKGQSVADRLSGEIYDEFSAWCLRDGLTLDFRRQVEALAMHWHWHRTAFRLEEHDDRVTYHLEPCGSGGRLIHEGAYFERTHRRPLSLLADRSRSTFNEPNFPSWCTHCADSNRYFLENGLNFVLHEGWTSAHRHGACAAHIFKSFDLIPDEHFSRVGLARDSHRPGEQPSECVFQESELRDLEARPDLRVADRLLNGDVDGAVLIIDHCQAAWTNLRTAYRAWLAILFRRLHTDLDVVDAALTMQASAWELVATVLEGETGVAQPWTNYWRSYCEGGLVDERNGTTTFVLPEATLTDDSLAPDEYLGQLIEAINFGVDRAGLRHGFGALLRQDGNIVHRAPTSL
jgi:hypothetical protein